uniref:Agenet-like domain-containing protein n=1 Tax=Oryza brachyantha TaxID=4533 RepID=J3N906_ORYBR
MPCLSPSPSGRRLSELLEEKQEPFFLDLHLLEKGCSARLLEGYDTATAAVCWPAAGNDAASVLKRLTTSKKKKGAAAARGKKKKAPAAATGILRVLLSRILHGKAANRKPAALQSSESFKKVSAAPSPWPATKHSLEVAAAVEEEMEYASGSESDDEKQFSPVSVLEHPFETRSPVHGQSKCSAAAQGSPKNAMAFVRDLLEAADGDPDGVVTVAFPITRELIAFPPRLVRPRRDYVDGEWVPSEVAIVIQPRHALRVYDVGDKVEVKRDREVYGHSWFPATVAKVIDKLSYLVEYSDLEGVEEAGGKAVEYLHWQFVRPSEELPPRHCDFRLGPGAAVEAYCEGAWSPGVVRRVVGEGEYEVSVNGMNKELLLTKVPELLKPQYRWNGKYWRIVTAKRHLRRQSVSGMSPSSPVDVFSSDDEHRHHIESSACKRSRRMSRKELKEVDHLEVMLTEHSEHDSRSEMDTPLSELVKSPGSNHSSKFCAQLSVAKTFQVLSKKIVSNCSVPVKMIPDSSGYLINQNESGKDCIGKTAVNQEIISDMLLMNGASAYGTNAGESCAMLSTKKFRRHNMALSGRNNHIRQVRGRPVSFQTLRTKKNVPFKLKQGKVRPIQAPQGRNDPFDNIQLKRNSTSNMEIVCALSVSSECNTPSPLAKLTQAFDVVSKGADSESNTRFFTSKKKLAKKRGFKESDSPHNSLDATSALQPRKKAAGRLKGSSMEVQLEGETHTQQQLDKSLEDDLNANEVTNHVLLPLTPPGFESIVNGKRSCDWNTDGLSETNLHSSLFDEELASTINSICQDNHNGDVQTDDMATQVTEISHLMEKPMLSLDRSVEQEVSGKVGQGPIQLHVGNSGNLQSTTDNTILRSCSFAGGSMASDMSMCQVSGQQPPFTKSSPIWSVVEAMDVFRKVPQRPHFLPLKHYSLALREGIALGLTMSYPNVVNDIRKLRITDSMETFEDSIKTLTTLEENGFNVQSLQRSLTKLLQFRSDYTNALTYREKLKAQILDKGSAVSRIGALLDEKDNAIFKLEQELGRLRWEAQKIAKNKEDEDAELLRLKAEDSNAQEACGDAKRQFHGVQAELRPLAIGS